PVVRTRVRGSLGRVCGGERAEGAEPLALRRRLVEVPRERGERAARRRAGDVVRVEEHPDLVPERARLARRALVVRRLADEVQAPRRPRAGGVEEEALTRDRVRLDESRPRGALVDRPAFVVGDERRPGSAARQAALLEAEQED